MPNVSNVVIYDIKYKMLAHTKYYYNLNKSSVPANVQPGVNRSISCHIITAIFQFYLLTNAFNTCAVCLLYSFMSYCYSTFGCDHSYSVNFSANTFAWDEQRHFNFKKFSCCLNDDKCDYRSDRGHRE